ncbi:MAG TPA: cell division protein FtsZ, partial [Gemmatimonadaceae bacterium]|nr:cell division protein FtsZ [Gemmatimonadaceae bacterium]
ATGVLVNITGGDDLTLGDVHQIVEIVKDAVGDDAEIIFGTVNEKAMQGECRVTVIATGFDKTPTHIAAEAAKEPHLARSAGTPVIPLPMRNRTVSPQPRAMSQPSNQSMNTPDISRRVTPLSPPSSSPDKADGNGQDLSDMEIPTFIRRQMD